MHYSLNFFPSYCSTNIDTGFIVVVVVDTWEEFCIYEVKFSVGGFRIVNLAQATSF
jgi:hypothetical protein